MTITQKDLYTRALQLEREILLLTENLKELKNEFTYHQDNNPEGMSKEVVAQTMKAAKATAKQDQLAEKVAELKEVIELQELYNN